MDSFEESLVVIIVLPGVQRGERYVLLQVLGCCGMRENFDCSGLPPTPTPSYPQPAPTQLLLPKSFAFLEGI